MKKHIHKINIDTLLHLRALINTSPQQANQLARGYILRTKQLQDSELVSELYHVTGMSYHRLNQYAKALKCYQKALELRQQHGNKKGAAVTLNNIALIYHDTNRYDDAVAYYLQAAKLKQDLNEFKSLTNTYSNLAATYEKKGDYRKSMEALYKALAISEELKDIISIGRIYRSIALIYHLQGDDRPALNMYKRARALQAGTDDKIALVQLDVNIGAALKHMKKYKQALRYYQQSLKTSKQIEYLQGILATTNNIGEILLIMKKPQQALQFLLECLQLATVQKEYAQQCDTANSLAELHISIQQFPQAKKYLQMALRIAIKTGAKKQALETCLQLSTLYEKMQQPVHALKYYKQYDQIKSSILNAQNANEISQLQTRYEVAKKDEQLQKSKLLQVESELKALRAQMDPHFIFNSLSSMRKELLEGNIDKADKYIVRFSRLLRLILDTTRTPMVKLSDNIELLHLYIQIEQNRQANSFSYNIKLATGINPQSIYVPGMILQPLVENAIVHGLFHRQDGKGKLSISFSKSAQTLKIKVSDNGIGRKAGDSNKPKNHQSHATSIIHETLALAWGSAMEERFFTIQDKTDASGIATGTEVTVMLPLKNAS